MAKPSEIESELRNAVRELDKAIVGWNFDKAITLHGHVQDLLEDLWAAIDHTTP